MSAERRKVGLGARLRYAFDNSMSRGTPALVGWLALATAILIAVFSAVVLLGNLAPDDEGSRPGPIGQVFKSLLHALDPGTIGGDEGSWQFLLTMLLLTFGGLLIVSALIGVLATGLDAKLQDLRKGRSFVIERDHTLILGWSDTVFTIISELAISNESEKDPVIVILADQDKVQMEDEVRAKVEDLRNTRVVCRTGTPIDLRDLEMVNPQDARSVIVLAPDRADPDSHVIKTILALTRAPGHREHRYNIVAEIQDPANLEAARLVGGDEAVLIDKRETVARLIVQASRQSGVSVVYSELLDFAGDEIYFRHDPQLVGRTFADALLAYDDCAVIGLHGNGDGTKLNPPPATSIEPGHELIAIAADDARLAAAQPCTAGVDEDAIVTPPPPDGRPESVLLLGWSRRSIPVIHELDKFLLPGSRVTVVADDGDPEAVISRERERLANVEVRFIPGSTTDRRVLESLAAERIGQVIVMSYADQLDPQEADARTLVTLLHLRDIAGARGLRFSIVSEMLDDRNRQLAQVTQVDDVIVSDHVISLMIAQVSENTHLREVFGELFSAEGSEVYLRPADHYLRAGRATNFATAVEAARRRGEVALGYRRAAEAGDPDRNYGVLVNPAKSTPLEPAPGDRVIVRAED